MRLVLVVLVLALTTTTVAAQERPDVFYVLTRSPIEPPPDARLPEATRAPAAQLLGAERELARRFRLRRRDPSIATAWIDEAIHAADRARDATLRSLAVADSLTPSAALWRIELLAGVLGEAFAKALERAPELEAPAFHEPRRLLERLLLRSDLDVATRRDAHGLAAYLALEMSDWVEARKHWQHALATGIDDARSRELATRLGELHFDERRFDDAAQTYRQSLSGPHRLWRVAAYKLVWCEFFRERPAATLRALARLSWGPDDAILVEAEGVGRRALEGRSADDARALLRSVGMSPRSMRRVLSRP